MDFTTVWIMEILFVLVCISLVVAAYRKKRENRNQAADESKKENAAFVQSAPLPIPEMSNKKEPCDEQAKPMEAAKPIQPIQPIKPMEQVKPIQPVKPAVKAEHCSPVQDIEYPLALPQNTILAGQYIIVKTLGQGGFGITYQAADYKTGQKVAVKEFFPDSMAVRTNRTTVSAFSGERGESYAYGKECFLQEAETLAQFIGNENIVRVYRYFEENGTAYFVMEYVEGTSFDRYIKDHGGKVPYEEAERILLPVIDALAAVHAKGIVHRDVTPDNIYITKEGRVKLLDFGAARYSLGDKSRSLDVVLKHGFAPKEQYTRHGRQGPYTDVYTLGASFYFAITGRRPPDSIDRLEEDELIPPGSLGVKIAPAKENAILTAMNVQPADRYQTMEEFRHALVNTES